MVNGHSAFGCRVGANTQVHPYPQLNQSIIKQTNISHPEGLHFSLFVSHSSLFVFHFSLFVFHFPCHSERQRRVFFCHFWLDPKVTQRSRLRALHTPSRRLQVGKSGNSLRFRQPDFLSPCSLLRRLTARGPLTNASAFACFPTLRFAAHWAELTRPFRALTAVSRQLRIPPLKGGLGGCSYQRHDGRTQRFAPTRRTEMGMRPTAPHNNSIPQQFSSLFTIRFSLFTSLVIQSEAKNLFPFPHEIPHCVRNDKEEAFVIRNS